MERLRRALKVPTRQAADHLSDSGRARRCPPNHANTVTTPHPLRRHPESMRTILVLILLLLVEALAIGLIVNPRWVMSKLLSPARNIVLRAQGITTGWRHLAYHSRTGARAGSETLPQLVSHARTDPYGMSTDTCATEVRAALRRDPRIKHPELIVVSVDGIGTVVLRGAVSSIPEHQLAVHAARQIDGAFEVIGDDLKIHPPVGDQRADDEIRAAAIQRLIWDTRIRSNYVHVRVSHGHLTLTGYVRGKRRVLLPQRTSPA